MKDNQGNSSIKLAIFAVAIIALAVSAWYFDLASYLSDFTQWVDDLGFWGPVVFALAYAAAAVALVPGTILTLAGGALFGVAKGTATVFVGASLGATAAFLIGRYLARDAIENRLGNNEKFAAIDDAVGREGLKIVTLLRLSPVFPFVWLNYGLGLTRVKLWHYVVACLGMLPGTLLYVYLGSAASTVAGAVGDSDGGGRSPAEWAFLGAGLLATLIVTIVVTRIARRALAEASDVESALEPSA